MSTITNSITWHEVTVIDVEEILPDVVGKVDFELITPNPWEGSKPEIVVTHVDDNLKVYGDWADQITEQILEEYPEGEMSPFVRLT